MCGIAGLFARGQDGRDVAAMSASLAHRGPDGDGLLGWWSSGRTQAGRAATEVAGADLVLGHRRLAVIDPSPAGHQPMGTVDGSGWLIFNGEIYNHLVLRSELEREGVIFRSRCDTEVLLYALQRWGEAALGRLDGMFALAWLDCRTRRLLLARDPFGIKPLYLQAGAHGLAFASEIKALHAVAPRPADDPQGVWDYLCHGFTDHRRETMLSGIVQLPAGHFAVIDLERAPVLPETVPYRVPRAAVGAVVSRDESIATCRSLFIASVDAQRVADVPVGCALSGGTDSSAILAAMRRSAPEATLHALGYCADHPTLGEERWIAIAANASAATLHRVTIAPEQLIHDLDDLIVSQDEPFGSTSVYAQYAVFRAARAAGITVMLDGQGADELLGGYLPFLGTRMAELLRGGAVHRAWTFAHACRMGRELGLRTFVRQTVARLIGGAPLPGGRPSWVRSRWFADRGVHSPLPPGRGLRAELESALRATTLPALLRYEDRNSMRFGIESRVPFCQLELAEFLLSLPSDHLIDDAGTTKSVFRAALRGLVPDVILDRRDKIGFVTPEAAWMTTLAPWIDRVIAEADPLATPYLDLPRLRQQIAWLRAGRVGQDFALWRTVNLLRWHQLAARGRAA